MGYTLYWPSFMDTLCMLVNTSITLCVSQQTFRMPASTWVIWKYEACDSFMHFIHYFVSIYLLHDLVQMGTYAIININESVPGGKTTWLVICGKDVLYDYLTSLNCGIMHMWSLIIVPLCVYSLSLYFLMYPLDAKLVDVKWK